ncbi:immunity protein TriTu family protein [Chengkuizengella marina]|uniref:immunity protein TriTu family protein n=1 Tax=Chengkuizengella marina TaxID=2507566 RepID=UPI00191C3AA0|nr:hypothetical protein [Chengkuizengella marina]
MKELFKKWLIENKNKFEQVGIKTDEIFQSSKGSLDSFIRVDHISSNAMGRITIYDSKLIDVEVIDITTGDNLFYQHLEVTGSGNPNFELLFWEYFESMQQSIRVPKNKHITGDNIRLLDSNRKITYSGEELIEVLREIELILISLHKIGSYYGENLPSKDGQVELEYAIETNNFIDDWKVARRLAKVRRILEDKFDNTLGSDDMDDLERAFKGIKYWTLPGDKAEEE